MGRRTERQQLGASAPDTKPVPQGFVRAPSYSQSSIFLKMPPDPRKPPNAKLKALSLSPFLSLQTHLKDYCFIMALTPVRMGISHLKGPSLRNAHPRPGLAQSGPRQDKPSARPRCLGQLLGVPFRTCSHCSQETPRPLEAGGFISGKPESEEASLDFF